MQVKPNSFQYPKVRLKDWRGGAICAVETVSIPEGAIEGFLKIHKDLIKEGFNTRRCD